MEKLLTIAFFIFFLAFAGCKTSQSKSESIPEDSALKANTKTEFSINGMHCTGCENTIKMNVKELKGVVSVDASFKDNKAEVAFDSMLTNEAAIVSAIKTAGYKVDTFIRK